LDFSFLGFCESRASTRRAGKSKQQKKPLRRETGRAEMKLAESWNVYRCRLSMQAAKWYNTRRCREKDNE